MNEETAVEMLTKGVPEQYHQAIRQAYWMGCHEGLHVGLEMKATQRAVSHRDETGNVLYLKDRKVK